MEAPEEDVSLGNLDVLDELPTSTEVAEQSLKAKVVYKKPPNRQRFEQTLNEIKQQIDSKEKEVQLLLSTSSDSPQTKLQELRENRNSINQKRRTINSQLEQLNQQINVKRDATAQLRTKLQYQTEAQIDQVIRRLEVQLQQHSFRLPEERRLVAEIDRLRRSKKTVKQYNEAKDELQQLRDHQQQLRTDRDSCSKELMNMRLEEDNLHSLIRKNRETVDILKRELDELHDKKRSQIADFKAEQALYLECKDQRRVEVSRQRTQEKLALAQARAQDREEIQCSIEPYQEEKHLCATLLNFLAKLESSTPSTTPLTPVTPSSVCSTPMTPDENMCKLPGSKEQAEDCLFLGIPRKASRKAKRSNSRAGSLNKKRLVPLTPDLLVQFASLNITAPASLMEVPAAMEDLKAKQKLLTCMANAELQGQNSKEEEVSSSQKTDGEVASAADVKLCPQSLCLDLPVSTSVQCIEPIAGLNNGLTESTVLI